MLMLRCTAFGVCWKPGASCGNAHSQAFGTWPVIFLTEVVYNMAPVGEVEKHGGAVVFLAD